MEKQIGPYKIVKLLGRGGMGEVYEGIHEQIKRRAAIKLLHAKFAHNSEVATRFLNEARAVNIVQHSSLVNIYEFGQLPDGSPYIVMEFLEGVTLRGRIQESGGRLEPEVTMRFGRQIAAAMAAAHGKGIVHRDLKPIHFTPEAVRTSTVPQA